MNEFVICIDDGGNPGSLVVGKVYRRLQDREASAHGMVRVVDEDISEPDGYLYPESLFVPIALPKRAEDALIAAGI